MDRAKRDSDEAAHRSAYCTVETANLMVAPLAKRDETPLRGIRPIIKHICWELVFWSNVSRIKRARPTVCQSNTGTESRVLRVDKWQVAHHRIAALQPSARMCDRRNESALWRQQEESLALTVETTYG